MSNALNNVSAEMVAAIKQDIEDCKTLAMVAYDYEAREFVKTKWRDLCDTLHPLGLSVAMFEV